MNPDDDEAYNFEEDNTYANKRSDSSTVYTAENGASMGGTTFKPVEEDGDESSEGDFWEDCDSDNAMDVEKSEEYQFENMAKVNEGYESSRADNKNEDEDKHGEDMEEDNTGGEECVDEQGNTEGGERNSGRPGVTEMEKDEAKDGGRTEHNNDASEEVKSVTGRETSTVPMPEYNEDVDAYFVVNSLLKLNKGGKTMTKEEYMKAQSQQARQETNPEKDVQEQESPAQMRENVTASGAATSTNATVQMAICGTID